MTFYPHKRLLIAAVTAVLAVLIFLFSGCGDKAMSNDYIVVTDNFKVTADSVIEDTFVARAVSPLRIISNYDSQPSDSITPVVAFRLWIAGRDNELPAGAFHYVPALADTTVVAGRASAVMPQVKAGERLAPNTKWNVKVDLSAMTDAFKADGYYVTATGDTVFAADFNGVWLTGNVPPLRGDSYDITSRTDLKLHPSASNPGIYEATINLNSINRRPSATREWSVESHSEDYPRFESGQLLVDALYNMAVDNIGRTFGKSTALRPSSTEICYPIMFALSYLAPSRSKQVLKSMVRNGKIMPGNSDLLPWPVVNGCLVWSAAAWEVYCVTGDKKWLRYAYEVTSASVEASRDIVADRSTGLMHGGSPCLSTNAYYYPQWMEPKDIFESQSLYVNIIYQHAYSLLAQMGEELELDGDKYQSQADRLQDALNHTLWNESRGRYMQYVYGPAYPVQSPFVDNMGQALSILWDIADDDRSSTLIEESPVTNYGVPSVYPRQQGIESVANAVHPLVQSMWNLAAKKTGNVNMLRRGLGAMYRLQALALNPSAMCDPSTGQIIGNLDAINGAAGNVAMVFRVFAGMKFLPEGIEFTPMIPDCFKGNRQITDFHYRNSVIDITIEGTGNDIELMKIDGRDCDDNLFPATLTGHHTVTIRLKNSGYKSTKVTVDPSVALVPFSPSVLWSQQARVVNFSSAQAYRIVVNGKLRYSVSDTLFSLPAKPDSVLTVYSLAAINKWGNGYASRPWPTSTATRIVPAVSAEVEAGTSLVGLQRASIVAESSANRNASMAFTVDVDHAGNYMLDVRYANGNRQGRCALRQVEANTHLQGALVMPCRGRGQWMTMGYSNMVPVELLRGRNVITITVATPAIPGYENCAVLIQHLRLMPL